MAGDARTAVGRGMMGLRRLLGEIHGRSLWQLLGIYLGASWLVLQVVGQITEALALPEWIQPLAIILLLLGLPVMLTTAIIQGGPRRPTEALRGPETGHAARAGVAAAAFALLGLIHSGLGDHTRAEQLLERSIRTDPTTSTSYTNLLFEQVAQRKAAAA